MLLLLVGVTMVVKEARSQTNSPVHVGFKGGANLSDLSFSGSNMDSKYSVGYHAGVFTRLDIARFYLQGELLYAQKRSKVEIAALGNEKVKWNTLEVPLLVGYKVYQSEDINFRVFGGGVYSYVLNERTSMLKQLSESFREFDRSNIGYQAGLGVDFGRLSLDLKYEGALTNISGEFKSKPNSFQASIGFAIF